MISFIGIVIFTVYTKMTVYSGRCDPNFSTPTFCADEAESHQEEMGEPIPQYIGEFPTLDACDAAARAATYPVKYGQRVDSMTQVICIPKRLPHREKGNADG